MEIGDNARAGAWRQLYASFWLGYRRVRTPVKGQFHCFNTDGTPMDYANVPHSGTGADGLHNELPGYPWNGPNPGGQWERDFMKNLHKTNSTPNFWIPQILSRNTKM
jgi:hypothetical protein